MHRIYFALAPVLDSVLFLLQTFHSCRQVSELEVIIDGEARIQTDVPINVNL